MREQPAATQAFLEKNGGRIREFARLVSDDVTHAVIAARGTSDNAARYAQYVWGARNRLSVALAAPSLFGPYASPPSLAGSVVVGISQSGQSPDLVEVLAEARRQARPTVAITNSPDSPLAGVADLVIDLAAGTEHAVAATKTYTAQLMAVAACSLAASGAGLDDLYPLPELLTATLDARGPTAEALAPLVSHDRCVVVGRGFHHATAFEWALKIQELAHVLAQPFSAADFLHGPIAVVEPGIPALVVATTGALLDPMAELSARLAADGARVVAVTDVADFPAHELIMVPPVDEWLAPIVAAPAVQRFAHDAAVARGLDPDAPRGLRKVTRTT